jgi:hypothetical protein
MRLLSLNTQLTVASQQSVPRKLLLPISGYRFLGREKSEKVELTELLLPITLQSTFPYRSFCIQLVD